MLRWTSLRLFLPTFAVAGLLANAAMPQSQDSQSVAEAARHAREQKKELAKPAKVFTDDDVKPAAPSESTATPAPANGPAPGSPANAPAAGGSTPAAGPKDEKSAKQIAAVKEMLKQMQSDLELLQRDQALKQDTYYSNPDFVHDTSGKSMLDALKQQIGDKQGEVDKLKAQLTELGGTLDAPAATPPKQ
jgi:hypothetical protein